MATLLVGFDSAWTAENSGAIAGVVRNEDDTFQELGPPLPVNYAQAGDTVLRWQTRYKPAAMLILLDQPTVVTNATGGRTVEKIVAGPIGRRRGGVQRTNTARKAMFGEDAPMWTFLRRFGGPGNPLRPITETCILETYPALTLAALRWTLSDPRPAGRLPKYNPKRKTFSISDWRHVCRAAQKEFRGRGLNQMAEWVDKVCVGLSPDKRDQDGLDASLCLLVALHCAERRECLMVGQTELGYMVVPFDCKLCAELTVRCRAIGLPPSEWVHRFRMVECRGGS